MAQCYINYQENQKSVNFSLEDYLPYSIDHGPKLPTFDAVLNNVLYLSVWAIFHSLMARQPVKKKLLEIIPESLERPLYVLQSAFLLHQVLRRDSEISWRFVRNVHGGRFINFFVESF